MESHDDVKIKECFNCSEAFVDDNDVLHCMRFNGEEVKDNQSCDEWN